MNFAGCGLVKIIMKTGTDAQVIMVSIIKNRAVIFSTIYRK
ncbi:MAG: hypothetical protein WCB31_00835 [Nitrososphaeraceae archaeon]